MKVDEKNYLLTYGASSCHTCLVLQITSTFLFLVNKFAYQSLAILELPSPKKVTISFDYGHSH